jgi:diacylglycerol O-acyltransferase / wax synthase
VTNVPGPQMELFVLGRKLIDLFPLAPLAQRQALCIAIMSYNGKLNFGLLGDFDAMEDLDNFVAALEHSIDELRVAAGVMPPAPPVAAEVAAPLTAATGRNGGAEPVS